LLPIEARVLKHDPNSRTDPSAPRRVLLVVAAPAEARAVRCIEGFGAFDEATAVWTLESGGIALDLVESGVGKAQAAGAVAWAFDPARHAGVVNLGVGGALPGAGLGLGSVVLATESVFADEGLVHSGGFETTDVMGFPSLRPGAGEVAPAWREILTPLTDMSGTVATVSTCSGTDEAARTIEARTGAMCEAMEGAAIGAALARLPTPPAFAEIRVISNTTGDRNRQRWDLPAALSRLTSVAREIDRLAGRLADTGETPGGG
jgi:futalosine hydrolase